jgi:hypothetical protein
MATAKVITEGTVYKKQPLTVTIRNKYVDLSNADSLKIRIKQGEVELWEDAELVDDNDKAITASFDGGLLIVGEAEVQGFVYIDDLVNPIPFEKVTVNIENY